MNSEPKYKGLPSRRDTACRVHAAGNIAILFMERSTRLSKIILISVLALLFCGCSSRKGAESDLTISDDPQELAEFRAAPIDLDAPFLPEPIVEDGTFSFSKGDTVLSVLKTLNAPSEAASEIIRSVGTRCQFDKISLGGELTYSLIEGKGISAFNFRCGIYEILHVQFENDQPVIRIEEIPHREKDRIYVCKVRKNSSMIGSAAKDGVSEGQVMELAKVFRSDIDFNNDIFPDDELRLWVREIQDDNGNKLGPGKIIAAVFVIGGKEYWGIKYDSSDGQGYFDKRGWSLKKTFIKSPLPFLRVTSGFTLRRFHPVLGKVRPHLGVDFGAPTGTPVMAAADGKIIFAGNNGGYGNLIRLQHNATLTTFYGHLSKILVKNGQRVRQGKIIGMVGSTGLSTGPHLHYGMERGGKAIDPMSVEMQTTAVVTSQSFREQRNRAVELLSNPTPGNVP